MDVGCIRSVVERKTGHAAMAEEPYIGAGMISGMWPKLIGLLRGFGSCIGAYCIGGEGRCINNVPFW